MTTAITMAKESGIRNQIASPRPAENEASAASRHAAAAGIEAPIFREGRSPIQLHRRQDAGAQRSTLVEGCISDCARIVRRGARPTLVRYEHAQAPYRVEGQEDHGIRGVKQFDWTLPDAIYSPHRRGPVGMSDGKRSNELERLGWTSGKRPDDRGARRRCSHSRCIRRSIAIRSLQNALRFAQDCTSPKPSARF